MASREDSPYSSASPPCMAHELADGQDGSFFVVDEEQRRDVARWRKSDRERLIARRLAFSADDRNRWSGAIGDGVASFVGDFSGRVVSFYWPFRGEPDLRPLMHTVWEQGGEAALPIVVAKATPLVFRTWRQGEALEKGVWNIPVPSGGREVVPDIVLAPVVGFDPDCYRLGYGGGVFDRTLVGMAAMPLRIGVGHECARIATIFPQPHDVPMDAIVTPDGITARQVGDGPSG
ncbi:MAG: 5-formyltetrahydrofolate cyclo-ligase [Ahrensia sp.]|nr:5-formyltetrahydrofolate cyclo-ligase [Ahrensia sp.]